jgi:hypothetical protein
LYSANGQEARKLLIPILLDNNIDKEILIHALHAYYKDPNAAKQKLTNLLISGSIKSLYEEQVKKKSLPNSNKWA